MKGKQRMKSFVFIQCKLLVSFEWETCWRGMGVDIFGTHCMTRRRELVITWLDDFLYMRSVFRCLSFYYLPRYR